MSDRIKNSYGEEVAILQNALGPLVLAAEMDRAGCPIIWVNKSEIISTLKQLKDGEGLEYYFLADLTAYDDKDSPEESLGRFVVVYNLFAPGRKKRLRVKVRLQENESISTAVSVWSAANWAEREVFDMFGIKFDGHPDLRRILMDQRWEGYPLRKDYHWRKYQIFSEPEEIPKQLMKED